MNLPPSPGMENRTLFQYVGTNIVTKITQVRRSVHFNHPPPPPLATNPFQIIYKLSFHYLVFVIVNHALSFDKLPV